VKIPFYHFFDTKLIFRTALLGSEALAAVVGIPDYLVLPTPPAAMDLTVLIDIVRQAAIPVGTPHRVLLTKVDTHS
jgi:chromosome partitioning protein